MTRAIVPHQGATLTAASVTALIGIAREHGITEQDVRHAVLQAGGNVVRAAQHMGRAIQREFRAFQDTSNGPNLRRSAAHEQIARFDHRNQPALTNSPATTQATPMNGSDGVGPPVQAQEGGEQQVSPIKDIWRRFPNTQTALLKWIWTSIQGNVPGSGAAASEEPSATPFDQGGQVKTGGTAIVGANLTSLTAQGPTGLSDFTTAGIDLTTPLLLQLRMTSPYNIVKKFGSQAGGSSQPQWLQLFDHKYTYYHVMECDWELSFVFNTVNNDEVAAFYIFWKYTNQDDPPIQWSTASTMKSDDAAHTMTGGIMGLTGVPGAGGVANLTPDDYMRMGGWHHKHVNLNTVTSTPHVISGHYKYGQCKMDIKTLMASDAHGVDTAAEGWAAVGSTPPFPEILSVIIVADNRYVQKLGTNPSNVILGVRAETEHLIQFKDLQSAYKFPTPALAQTSQTGDAQYFWRGAGYT